MIEKLSWDKPKDLDTLLATVRSGELCIGSTDTVLGLMGNIDALVQKKIDNVKQREEKPYIILQDSIRKVKSLARIDSIHIEKFLELCWPGPVTIILPKDQQAPTYVGSQETVGIRIPNHEGLLYILRALPYGLYSTSANISGEPIPRSIKEVSPSILQACRYYVDDKACEELPSTIIDCSQGVMRVVREGAFPIERLLYLYKQASD